MALLSLRSLYTTEPADRPNLILLDLNLPGMSGLEALPNFRAELPSTKIIVLTQSDSEADVLRAISRGASGYLLKSASLQEITEGIEDVMNGGASLDPGVAQFILSTLKQKLPENDLKNLLTEREQEVLTLLSEGLVKKGNRRGAADWLLNRRHARQQHLPEAGRTQRSRCRRPGLQTRPDKSHGDARAQQAMRAIATHTELEQGLCRKTIEQRMLCVRHHRRLSDRAPQVTDHIAIRLIRQLFGCIGSPGGEQCSQRSSGVPVFASAACAPSSISA